MSSVCVCGEGLNLTHQYKDHHFLYSIHSSPSSPPPHPCFRPPSLTRSIVRTLVLADGARTYVCVSLGFSFSSPALWLSPHRPLPEPGDVSLWASQHARVYRTSAVTTPLHYGRHTVATPTRASIHKVDRGQRARTGWAGLCALQQFSLCECKSFKMRDVRY